MQYREDYTDSETTDIIYINHILVALPYDFNEVCIFDYQFTSYRRLTTYRQISRSLHLNVHQQRHSACKDQGFVLWYYHYSNLHKKPTKCPTHYVKNNKGIGVLGDMPLILCIATEDLALIPE